MIFKELHLSSFGKFQDRVIPFKKGLNIIFGKNESGKSTLFHALLGTLFGFRQDRNRYLPWKNPSQYRTKLFLETETQRVELERDFLEDKVMMKQSSIDKPDTFTFHGKAAPSGRSSEREVYLKKIHQLFGFSDPDIFRSSLFIEQRSLHHSPDIHTATELKQLISNISEFKYDEIIHQLEEKYYHITKRNPKGVDKRNDRLLENVVNQIQQLEERIRRAHEDQKNLLKIGKKVADVKEKLVAKERRQTKLQRSIESLHQLIDNSQQIVHVEQTFSEVKKKKILVEKLLFQRKEVDKESPKLNRILLGALIFSVISFPFLYYSSYVHWSWLILIFSGLFISGTLHYLKFKKEISFYDLKDLRLKSQLEVLPELKHIESEYTQHQRQLRTISARTIETEKNVTDIHWTSDQLSPENLAGFVTKQETELDNLTYETRALQSSLQLEKQHDKWNGQFLEASVYKAISQKFLDSLPRHIKIITPFKAHGMPFHIVGTLLVRIECPHETPHTTGYHHMNRYMSLFQCLDDPYISEAT